MDIKVKEEVLDVHEDYSDVFFDCDIVKEETTIQEANVLVEKRETGEAATNEELVNSEITEIKSKEEHKCDVCGKKFLKLRSFQTHMLVHNNTFPCDKCNKRFRVKELLVRHQKTHVTPDKDAMFQCMYCTKSFKKRNSRQNHLKLYHRGLPKSEGATPTCTICRKVYKKLSFLKKHIDEVHPKRSKTDIYECAICGVQTKYKPSLKNHITRIHLRLPDNRDKKDQTCPVCSISVSKRQLEGHISSHSTEKPFSCDTCGKTYKTKEHYKIHLFTHMVLKKEQGMKCGYCERTYYVQTFFTRHTRNKHRGLPNNAIDPPFKCTVCRKSYEKIDELKEHVTVHKDDLKCTICGFTFSMKNTLRRHTKKFHQKKVD